jgi:hypothetical protein
LQQHLQHRGWWVRYSPRTDGFIQQLILGPGRTRLRVLMWWDPRGSATVGMSFMTPALVMRLPGCHFSNASDEYSPLICWGLVSWTFTSSLLQTSPHWCESATTMSLDPQCTNRCQRLTCWSFRSAGRL